MRLKVAEDLSRGDVGGFMDCYSGVGCQGTVSRNVRRGLELERGIGLTEDSFKKLGSRFTSHFKAGIQ